ncbi:centromere protein C [Biomphalaria pfeifferi]|uniref:Centromere protein C n=1 Tax=Biomphalaria pfeifferi TaxID=112525 RepID=A0AAD8BYD4_BIOPF|nr:centromere protein C [Biomphalaria pfeifferi]
MEPPKSLKVVNPFRKGQNIGRRTGQIISKKRLKKTSEMDSFDEYLSESEDDRSMIMPKQILPIKENVQPIPQLSAQVAKNSPVIILQSETQPQISSAHKEIQSSQVFLRALNPYAGNPRYGRRTGKDLLAGKTKLLTKGLENFSDFFSDSDISVSTLGTSPGTNTPTTSEDSTPKTSFSNSLQHAEPCQITSDATTAKDNDEDVTRKLDYGASLQSTKPDSDSDDLVSSETDNGVMKNDSKDNLLNSVDHADRDNNSHNELGKSNNNDSTIGAKKSINRANESTTTTQKSIREVSVLSIRANESFSKTNIITRNVNRSVDGANKSTKGMEKSTIANLSISNKSDMGSNRSTREVKKSISESNKSILDAEKSFSKVNKSMTEKSSEVKKSVTNKFPCAPDKSDREIVESSTSAKKAASKSIFNKSLQGANASSIDIEQQVNTRKKSIETNKSINRTEKSVNKRKKSIESKKSSSETKNSIGIIKESVTNESINGVNKPTLKADKPSIGTEDINSTNFRFNKSVTDINSLKTSEKRNHNSLWEVDGENNVNLSLSKSQNHSKQNNYQSQNTVLRSGKKLTSNGSTSETNSFSASKNNLILSGNHQNMDFLNTQNKSKVDITAAGLSTTETECKEIEEITDKKYPASTLGNIISTLNPKQSNTNFPKDQDNLSERLQKSFDKQKSTYSLTKKQFERQSGQDVFRQPVDVNFQNIVQHHEKNSNQSRAYNQENVSKHEDSKITLNFGGDVNGSVSKMDKASSNQFFGIKKRLTFSTAIVDGGGSIKETKKHNSNIYMNNFKADTSQEKVSTKSPIDKSKVIMNSTGLDVTFDQSDEFLIVDEPIIVVNRKNMETQSVNKKQKGKKKNHTATADKFISLQSEKSDNLSVADKKTRSVLSMKPVKRKLDITSFPEVKQHEKESENQNVSVSMPVEVPQKKFKINKTTDLPNKSCRNVNEDTDKLAHSKTRNKSLNVSKPDNENMFSINEYVDVLNQSDFSEMESPSKPKFESDRETQSESSRKMSLVNKVILCDNVNKNDNHNVNSRLIKNSIEPGSSFSQSKKKKVIKTPPRQIKKPTRRGPKVSKSKKNKHLKATKVLSNTRKGQRKAIQKAKSFDENEMKLMEKVTIQNDHKVTSDDLHALNISEEIHVLPHDVRSDQEMDIKLPDCPQINNNSRAKNKILDETNKLTLSFKQPKVVNKKKHLMEENSVSNNEAEGTLTLIQNSSILVSPFVQGAIDLNTCNSKKSRGRKKSVKKCSASSQALEDQDVLSTPVHLNLLSALPQVTPKSGISFRPSQQFTTLLQGNVDNVQLNDSLAVLDTTPCHRKTPAVLTSCLRDSSVIRPRRKGRRVRISQIIDQQEVSPRSSNNTANSTKISDSGLLSMSSSPVHYAEITNEDIPTSHAPKIILPDLSHKIVRPEPPPCPGLRRSKRTRVLRLNRDRGEGIIYRRDSAGFGLVVDGIKPSVGEAKVKALEEERRKRRLRKRLQSVTVPSKSKRRLSTHFPIDQDVTMSSEYPILNPETGTEVLVDCVARNSSITWFGPDLTPVSDTDSLAVGLLVQQPSVTSGELQLRPLAEKPLGLAIHSLVYFVYFGKIAVTINRATTVVEIGDSFIVPRGNYYSVKNVRRDIAKLFFVDLNDTCERADSKQDQSSSLSS